MLNGFLIFLCTIFMCTAGNLSLGKPTVSECPSPVPHCYNSESPNCRATLIYETINGKRCAVRCETKCNNTCPSLPACPASRAGCSPMYKYTHFHSDMICPTRCELKCACPKPPTCAPPPSKNCKKIKRNKIIDNTECPWGCVYDCCKDNVKCPKPDSSNPYCATSSIIYGNVNGQRCPVRCVCVPDCLRATCK